MLELQISASPQLSTRQEEGSPYGVSAVDASEGWPDSPMFRADTNITTIRHVDRVGVDLAGEELAFRSPLLPAAFGVWQDLREDGELPLKASFVPERHARLWPYLIVVDVIDGGRDYYVRYFGANLVDIYGELSRRRVSDIETNTDARGRGQNLFSRCVRESAPTYLYERRSLARRRDYLDVEALALPFTHRSGGGVDVIISCIVNELSITDDSRTPEGTR